MHNRLKKAVVFGLSACLMLGSLSGCSKKEAEFDPEATAVTVNGDEISAGLVKFATHYTQALTEDLYKNYMGVSDPMSQDIYGNGSTMGDMIKSQTVTTLENMVLAEQKMEEYGVELTDDEKSTISEAAKKFLDDNPDFDYDQDVKDATAVADAMKAEGWEFASHTWGHKNATESSAKELKTDDKKWKSYVAPILGDTDMIIFAFGADIGDWEGYSSDNAKFKYYKKAGYDYFCNVDSSQYFVQITDQYFRQGRRNLDGYRMYYNPDMLSDLFDVSEVWDSSRPTPVPEM